MGQRAVSELGEDIPPGCGGGIGASDPGRRTRALPDAQLEYTDEDGRTSRVNIEVASGHYRASAIQTKACAEFVVHATGRSRARVLRALSIGEDHASIRGLAQRDPAAFEL